MALLFGAPARKLPKTDDGQEVRLAQAREAYLAGRIKIVTTDQVPNQEVAGTFGLIVCRGFVFENAFHGLIAQALDVNADAIVAYRESVAFHPEGDRYYSCYGTAVRLKIKK
ncbi:hypothetical protein M7784_14440 [Desulfovibrio aminophilus]|nr:hypothetical protein [Desulfovibrio aminophilus]MCM0756431.1 hypothetical protein [Desulfovibrio aminophilus]